jgi:hypothetical protein
MKGLTTVLLFCLVCSGTMALAQNDSDPDGIGIYFDTAATTHCSSVPMGPFELYLILTNASAEAGVAGWECRIEFTDDPLFIVTAWDVHNWSGGFSDPPNFMQGLYEPLPWSEAINLMTISALTLTPECIWLFIVPHPYPSIPGQIIYVDAADYFNLIPMFPSTGGYAVPVAGVNCECPPPIAAKNTTWGGMKAMYRDVTR